MLELLQGLSSYDITYGLSMDTQRPLLDQELSREQFMLSFGFNLMCASDELTMPGFLFLLLFLSLFFFL